MNDPVIWIVVPVFNRVSEIYSLINDFFRQSYSKFKIVIVDHGTRKIDFSSFSDERIIVISGSSDYWWTEAVNYGIRFAYKEKNKKDLILVINDDVSLENNYLINIIKCSNKYPSSIIGSISVNKNNENIINAGSNISYIQAKSKSSWEDKTVDNISEEYKESDFLSGRGLLIPDEVIKVNGLFDQINLPHYAADYEYVWRAKRKSIKSYCCKSCIVYTAPKSRNVYMYKKSFRDFIFDKKKPGNMFVVNKMAFLCFNKFYACYYISINFIRFVLAYVKQYILKNRG